MTVIELCTLPSGLEEMALPPMHLVEQRFRVPEPVDPAEEIGRQWDAAWSGVDLPPGASVAVGVGSRGIDGLAEIVGAVVARLETRGLRALHRARHGLARRRHGRRPAGRSRRARHHRGLGRRADPGIARRRRCWARPTACRSSWTGSRPRPTASCSSTASSRTPTSSGRVESGLMKMLVIGLGNESGATSSHRHAPHRAAWPTSCGPPARGLLERANVVLGIALVENQRTAPARCVCCRRNAGSTTSPSCSSRRGRCCPACPWTTSTCCSSTRWART